MLENEILAEIHRTRESIARESDYDVTKLFAHFQEVQDRLEAQGWRVASPEARKGMTYEASGDAASVLREEPPQ